MAQVEALVLLYCVYPVYSAILFLYVAACVSVSLCSVVKFLRRVSL